MRHLIVTIRIISVKAGDADLPKLFWNFFLEKFSQKLWKISLFSLRPSWVGLLFNA